MHLAAENGHEAVTDTLLKNRAYVGVKSKLGVTPLHLAAQNGHNKLVRLLIERHSAAKNALTLVRPYLLTYSHSLILGLSDSFCMSITFIMFIGVDYINALRFCRAINSPAQTSK